jgi:hypothetical protein
MGDGGLHEARTYEGDDQERVVLLPVLAMVRTLSVPALSELERALSLELAETETAAERRWRKLGSLARMLEIESPGLLGYPVIERQRYDELRPEGAPASARLVGEFGSWKAVLRAANGLQPSGRAIYPGQPWVATKRGSRRPPWFTIEEVVTSRRWVPLRG